MTRECAEATGSGYAWGREDATGHDTRAPAGGTGSFEFAMAYAAAWDAYNRGERGYMMPVRDAYEAWQASDGRTIERGAPADL